MASIVYTVIKNDKQYDSYCRRHEELVVSGDVSKAIEDEIELIELLIDKYDEEHCSIGKKEYDPVSFLKLLMKQNGMRNVDLAKSIGVSEGLISDMLNYKKAMSKETIRILADKFKVAQEAFNKPYKLKNTSRSKKRKLETTLRRKTYTTV